MKKEVSVCDKCMKDIVNPQASIRAYDGSSYNGVDRDYWYKVIDLCFSCAVGALRKLFSDRPMCNSEEDSRAALKSLGLHDLGERQ